MPILEPVGKLEVGGEHHESVAHPNFGIWTKRQMVEERPRFQMPAEEDCSGSPLTPNAQAGAGPGSR